MKKKMEDYKNPYNFLKVREMKSSADRIENLLENYENDAYVSQISLDNLDEILYKSEKISLTCREKINEKIEDTESSVFEIGKKNAYYFYKNYPVKVEFHDSELHVYTPLTFKRFYRNSSVKENYTLMNYVAMALKKWSDDNNFTLVSSIKTPLICVIVRRSMTWNRNKICDNDNLENGRIINTIIGDGLSCPDNALNMSVYTKFEFAESKADEGMEFIVFSEADLPSKLHILSRKTIKELQ